jgi:transposase-like protein
MLAEALQAEVGAYIAAHAAERDGDGRRLVVRNGHHQPREVLISAGAVEVTVPRVNDRRTDPQTGERRRFSSAILPPWARKTPKITEVLPLLYLHGLSTGDFVPALGQFLGSSAGLSAPVITRLTERWQGEQRAFAARDLSGADYVYLWADGIHVNIRLEEHKLCLLVMIGVRADGRKELIALADGYRESAESWADLLRDCARRGMRAPVLAAGDGALGFWGALREVFPEAREQRCWFHKSANVLAALPRSAHPGAKKALAGIWGAEDKQHALAAVRAFSAAYGSLMQACSRSGTCVLRRCCEAASKVYLATADLVKQSLGSLQLGIDLSDRDRQAQAAATPLKWRHFPAPRPANGPTGECPPSRTCPSARRRRAVPDAGRYSAAWSPR